MNKFHQPEIDQMMAESENRGTNQLLIADEIIARRLQAEEYGTMQKATGQKKYKDQYEELGINLRCELESEKPLDRPVLNDLSEMNDLDSDGACGGGHTVADSVASPSNDDAELARLLQAEYDYDQSRADMSLANHLREEETRHRTPLSRLRTSLSRGLGTATPLRTRYERHSRGSHSGEFEPWEYITPPGQERQRRDHSEERWSPGLDIGPDMSNLPAGDSDLLLQEYHEYGGMSDENFIHIMRDPELLASMLMERAPDMMVPDDVDLNDYEALWNLAECLGEVKKCGMTDEEISRLPTHQHRVELQEEAAAAEPDSECRVCLTQFEMDESIRTLPCFHEFHVSCIDEWLRRNAVCPVCRKKVVTEEEQL